MDTTDSLPEPWAVWNDETHRVVLVYRPDIFDSDEFPPPCLPTLHLRKGKRSRRPGRDQPQRDDPWYVTLSLEPDVTGESQQFEDRNAAIDGASEIAATFDAGEVDYRSLYQVPREDYLAKLDELTGREA